MREAPGKILDLSRRVFGSNEYGGVPRAASSPCRGRQRDAESMIATALPDCHITATEMLTGGFSNTNYKVYRAEQPPVVLRIIAQEPDIVRKEAAICHLIHAAVSVPEILYSDAEGKRFGHAYSIIEWIDGIALSTLLATSDGDTIGQCAYAAGKTLAGIARFTFPAPGLFGPDLTVPAPFGAWRDSLSDYVAACLFQGHASRWLGDELMEQLWQLVVAKASYLDALPPGARLVHGDYKGQNLLVRQHNATWDIAAVLDWEFAYAGTPLIDLGIFLRYEADLPATYAHEVVRGYTEHGGDLPENWRPIIKLLDLVNLCDFLNSPLHRPQLYANVIGVIRQTLALFALQGW